MIRRPPRSTLFPYRRSSDLRDAIDLVAATVDALGRVVEDAIFGEDVVDGRAAARGVVFTEDVVKIAGQQGRYAEGHGLPPLGSLLRGRATPRWWSRPRKHSEDPTNLSSEPSDPVHVRVGVSS